MREDDLRLVRQEADDLRKARDDFRLKLRKKEWECESRTMERDQQKSNVDKLRLKLNRKATEINECWSREQELQDRVVHIQDQVRSLL